MSSRWRSIVTKLQPVVRWFGGLTPSVLLALVLIVGATWVFIEIADEVVEGETGAFDQWLLRALRQPHDPAEPLGPRWLQEMGRDATALGGLGWLFFFTLVIAGFLWLEGKHRLVVLLLATTASGALISQALKMAFARPRPDIVPHLSHVMTSSFPSGHSLLSAVVYLTLGVMVAAAVPHNSQKIYALAVAVFITLIVGASRVYLGVHYPTDVLAGWLAGLVWALVCWLVARWLQRRGKIEREGETSPAA
jgi:undecaprenyl-diphosphatase